MTVVNTSEHGAEYREEDRRMIVLVGKTTHEPSSMLHGLKPRQDSDPDNNGECQEVTLDPDAPLTLSRHHTDKT